MHCQGWSAVGLRSMGYFDTSSLIFTCCLQAMGSEVKYQDAIIERNQNHVAVADNQLRNLSNQAVKDHRLGHRRR